jgi:hypothetical protein
MAQASGFRGVDSGLRVQDSGFRVEESCTGGAPQSRATPRQTGRRRHRPPCAPSPPQPGS